MDIEELLKKIKILEENQAQFMQKMTQLDSDRRLGSPSLPKTTTGSGGGGTGPSVATLTDKQYINILQSVGQAVHIIDLKGRITYWNKSAENLYGYSVEEALGKISVHLVVDSRDYGVAYNIIHRVNHGETWTGQFSVKHSSGRRFFLNDNAGTFIGNLCTTADAQPFYDVRVPVSTEKHPLNDSCVSCRAAGVTTEIGVDPQQPLRKAVSSKMTNLASMMSNKVKSKIREARENNLGGSKVDRHSVLGSDSVLSDNREDGTSTIAMGDIPPATPFGVFIENGPLAEPLMISGGIIEEKSSIHKLASKAEAWIGKQWISWPRKGNEGDEPVAKASSFVWPWLQNDQLNVAVPPKSCAVSIPEHQVNESNPPKDGEALVSWAPPLDMNRAISLDNISSNQLTKLDVDIDCLDYEIFWEDMIIGGQIGHGNNMSTLMFMWSCIP